VEKLASGESWTEMKEFLQKVGSNRILRDETLTASFVKPGNSLAQTQLAPPAIKKKCVTRTAVELRSNPVCPTNGRAGGIDPTGTMVLQTCASGG
jgi:hypothetical protein